MKSCCDRAPVRAQPIGRDALRGWRRSVSNQTGRSKACPSLPPAPYAARNVRDASLESLWHAPGVIQFTRERTVDELWGFCKTCYYADECRAGCSWTVHTTLGKRGNNPFCYHRVKELEKRGERECLVSIRNAPGTPYDFGQFELRTEKTSTDPAASPPK